MACRPQGPRMTTLDPPALPPDPDCAGRAGRLAARAGALCARRCFSPRCCCSRCSRCSPRWCCRGSAARRRCGRSRWCSSRPACSPATPMPISWCATLPLGLGALGHLGVLALAAATLPIGIAHGFDTPPDERHRALADRPVCALDRPAVRRAVGERAAAAGLVRGERPRRRRAILTCSMPPPISARSRR